MSTRCVLPWKLLLLLPLLLPLPLSAAPQPRLREQREPRPAAPQRSRKSCEVARGRQLSPWASAISRTVRQRGDIRELK